MKLKLLSKLSKVGKTNILKEAEKKEFNKGYYKERLKQSRLEGIAAARTRSRSGRLGGITSGLNPNPLETLFGNSGRGKGYQGQFDFFGYNQPSVHRKHRKKYHRARSKDRKSTRLNSSHTT